MFSTHEYDLFGRKIMKGSGVLDDINSAFHYKTQYEGERHGMVHNPLSQKLEVANFLGPGTRLDLRRQNPKDFEPKNDLDNEAKIHDLNYEKAARIYDNNKDKNQFKKNVWDADDQFIKNARKSKDDPGIGKIAANLMSLKKTMEKSGILDTKTFSGRSEKKNKKKTIPDFILEVLKKDAMRKRKVKKIK